MKLMFHVHAIHLTFGVNERKLAKRLDVAVKMEPSTKPNSFLLQIISYEKNAGISATQPLTQSPIIQVVTVDL